jgi:predicted pyridoxine 5'-phosphate oxidase superfamily flavin-nucleotide-binding protein
MKINDAFREDMKNAVLCWVATVSADGVPNVSPKEIFSLFDDETLVFADIMSPITVRNIAANSRVCVSFVDVFRQKGFKVEGGATIVPQGTKGFERYGASLLEAAGNDFKIRNIICVQIERVSRILAPSYMIFPDRTEDEQMRRAYETYGVQPIAGTRP